MEDKVKAKIIELCPDVMEDQSIFKAVGGTLIKQETPITLAVVLRAMLAHTNEKGEHTINDKEFNEVVWHWKWAKDNYDQQSEECKQFIGQLLGVN